MNKELLLNVKRRHTGGGSRDRGPGRNIEALSKHAEMGLGRPSLTGVECGEVCKM